MQVADRRTSVHAGQRNLLDTWLDIPGKHHSLIELVYRHFHTEVEASKN
jgi:hypothetical protein